VVERAAGQGVQVLGALAGDVDAERLAEHADGVRVQRGLGSAAGARDDHVAGGLLAQEGLGDGGPGTVAGTDEQHSDAAGP
jgi:hypothetical protein